MKPPASKRAGLSARHVSALVEVFEALEPDYRPGLRWDAMLYHALFGVPGLLERPRPSLESAHEATEAYLSARDAGIYLARIPQEAIPGLLDGLEKEKSMLIPPPYPPVGGGAAHPSAT